MGYYINRKNPERQDEEKAGIPLKYRRVTARSGLPYSNH